MSRSVCQLIDDCCGCGATIDLSGSLVRQLCRQTGSFNVSSLKSEGLATDLPVCMLAAWSIVPAVARLWLALGDWRALTNGLTPTRDIPSSVSRDGPDASEFASSRRSLLSRYAIDAGTGVDIGSMNVNVNGMYRHLFPAWRYIGVDMEPGPGVDIVVHKPCRYPIFEP
jgi:hypothetical protein